MNMTWTDFKAIVDSKKLNIQYTTENGYYCLSAFDNIVCYECDIEIETPASTDQEDFEDNYKDGCNEPIQPKTDDGKCFVRAESRPLDMTTCFTCRGDSATVIGGGAKLMWNAAVDTFTDIGGGFKRLKIDFGFKDEVCIKEGAIYFWDANWYGELEMHTYIPAAYSPTGNDLFIDKFVISHFFNGDCPMGDELNTECASAKIPSYIRHQLWITIPSGDNDCKGFVSLEVYREDTV